jgi:ABC-type branched-subunit amino acid transport system ATPase component
MTALLVLDGVSRRFGGLNAVDGVSFSVEKGDILGLIGPNGAGKTTIINLITGVHRATGGSVRFEGRDITQLRPYQIARLGLARLSISHRVVVLHHGQLIAQGRPSEVLSDKNVIEAYLGSKYAAANPRGVT